MINLFKKNKKQPEDLKEVSEYLNKLDAGLDELKKNFSAFTEKSKKDLQKTGMVRFNPFGEIGGNQSFSIAVLDANNDGFVLTSHFGKELNRVYAKPIKNGESPHVLSEEEKEAIKKALDEK